MALVEIRTADTSLVIDQNNTITTADLAASSGTLTVKNITGFAVNQILLIGFLGNQGSEIVKTHPSTAPTGSTITLATSTVFPHSSSTTVTVMPYDQVEISTATTANGSKSVLITSNIIADSVYTTYNDTALSSGFYFARFKNSISGLFSTYSSPIPVTSYTPLMARSIIDSALGMINKDTSTTLSDDYAFAEIDNCQIECIRDLKRWSFMEQFNFNLGELTTGQWTIPLPVDCDDQYSIKSLYNFRIGRGGNLRRVDQAEWNEIMEGVAMTNLGSNISINDSTVQLVDSSDFDQPSGTFWINGNGYAYTANNQTTGVMTLSTPATTTATAGYPVFQHATIGAPSVWTSYNGNIYFYPILGSFENKRNAWLDYYVAPVQTLLDTQTILLPDPTVVQYFLAWKFLLKLNNGKSTEESEIMYGKFDARKKKMIQKETINQTFELRRPRGQGGYRRGDPKWIRLQGFWG